MPRTEPPSPDASWRAAARAAARVREGRAPLGEPGSAAALELLAAVHGLRRELDRLEPRLIATARQQGASWAEVAPALGVASRQAAERRFLRLDPGAGEDAGVTHEQRVAAVRGRRAAGRSAARRAADEAGPLRELAGQVGALEGLDAAARRRATTVRVALGADDPAELVGPLTAVEVRLRTTHPELAGRLAALLARVAGAPPTSAGAGR